MSKLKDFKCKIANTSGFSQAILDKYNPVFPQSYIETDKMIELSQAVKMESNSKICILPFCHTMEAEAYGGIINLSEGVYGPRAKDFAYSSFDELLNLPDFDFENGRLANTLNACKKLKETGENVCLILTGYNTILSNLIDTSKFYKNFRKRPEDCDIILNHISKNLLELAKKAIEINVDVICYSDPVGSLSIIGPKFSEKIVVGHTLPLLKKISDNLGSSTILNLCPKTTWLLLGLDMAEKEYVYYPEKSNYIDVCLQEKGKSKILGQSCVKNPNCIIRNGKIWRINLI